MDQSEPTKDGRPPSTVQRVKARAKASLAWIEDARPRFGALDISMHLYERDRGAGGNLLAGALAFRAFLWLIPFAFVLVAGLGFASAAGEASPSDVSSRFGITGVVAQQIASVGSQAERGRWVTLAIGLLALFGASKAAAKGFRAVHAIAWRSPPHGLRRGNRAGLVFMGGATLVIGAGALADWLREISPGPGVVAMVLMFGVYSAIWLGASVLLPHADAPWRELVPGALLFGVGIQAMHLITVLGVSGLIGRATPAYGALGVAITVLATLYLVGRLVVASAMLNASKWERQRAEAAAARAP
jgi:uncharacterized BrkB/YihY/UPF0761 family membrane protein